MRRILALLLALACVIALMAGCAPADEGKQPDGSTDKSGDTAETNSGETNETNEGTEETDDDYVVFPANYLFNSTQSGVTDTTYNGGQNGQNLILETLFAKDTDTMEYVPRLAKELDISDDGLVYTVTLNDATFHDGSKVTADDVVFSYNYAAKASSNSSFLSTVVGYDEVAAGTADSVSGIQALDEKTVQFTLSTSDATFMRPLSHSHFSILPQAAFEGMDWADIRTCDFWSHPIGSGPYYISETHYPDYIELSRYDGYYGEPAGVEKVILRYYTDMESVNAAIAAGEVHWCRDTGYEDAINISNQNSDVEVILSDSLYCRYLTVNATGRAEDGQYHPGMTNARVRQALNMLIDKQAICNLYGESATPLSTMVNPNVADYNSDIPLFERNVEKAVEILEEENFDFTMPVRLYTYYTDQVAVDVLDIIVQNFADGGVEAEYYIDGSNGAYIFSAGNFDLMYGAYSVPFASDLYDLYHDDRYVSEDMKPTLKERYTDLQYQWKTTLDPVQQKAIVDQLQYNGMEDMLCIPLYTMSSVTVINSGHFQGFPAHSTDWMSMYDPHTERWQILP